MSDNSTASRARTKVTQHPLVPAVSHSPSDLGVLTKYSKAHAKSSCQDQKPSCSRPQSIGSTKVSNQTAGKAHAKMRQNLSSGSQGAGCSQAVAGLPMQALRLSAAGLSWLYPSWLQINCRQRMRREVAGLVGWNIQVAIKGQMGQKAMRT